MQPGLFSGEPLVVGPSCRSLWRPDTQRSLQACKELCHCQTGGEADLIHHQHTVHELCLSPAHMEAKPLCLFTVSRQCILQLAVGGAEEDDVVCILLVSEVVSAEGNS